MKRPVGGGVGRGGGAGAFGFAPKPKSPAEGAFEAERGRERLLEVFPLSALLGADRGVVLEGLGEEEVRLDVPRPPTDGRSASAQERRRRRERAVRRRSAIAARYGGEQRASRSSRSFTPCVRKKEPRVARGSSPPLSSRQRRTILLLERERERGELYLLQTWFL